MATQKSFSFENFTFILSLLVAAAIIGTFFYLQYEIGKKKSELDSLSVEALKTKTEEQKRIENRILSTQQKLNDFSGIINNHKTSTAFFAKLEEYIHPDVFFTSCSLKAKEPVAELNGRAKTFEALGQQVNILSAAKDFVKDVKVEKIGIDDKGNVEFTLVLNVDPQSVIFK